MKRFQTLDVWHFTIAIQIMTLAILLFVILAAPGIGVLHAPPVTRSIGSTVPGAMGVHLGL